MKKKFCFLFIIFIGFNTAVSAFQFTAAEEAYSLTIPGWDFDYIDIRNGNNFGNYTDPESFFERSSIRQYEVEVKKNNNAVSKKIIANYDKNGKLLYKKNIQYESESSNFYYDEGGRCIGTNGLNIRYDDEKKVLSENGNDLYSYELVFLEDGYQIVKESFSGIYKKTTFRKFIVQNGNLIKVIDGKVLSSGKVENGLSYSLEYEDGKIINLKTFNLNGTIRSEQQIVRSEGIITVNSINYSNGQKVQSNNKWILSDFDKMNNWLKAVYISNDEIISEITRKIKYTSLNCDLSE